MIKGLLLLFIFPFNFQIAITQLSIHESGLPTTLESFAGNEQSGKYVYSLVSLKPGDNGVNFESNLTVDSLNPTQILPLNFLSVTCRIIGTHSFIQWSVSEDNDVNYYELEESHNGSVFQLLINRPANRNNFMTEYVSEDETLNIGNNFYRIKAVGISGKTIYSKIIKISYGKVDNTLFVYPNPAKDVLNVQLHGLLRGNFKLHIYNDAGQEIYRQSLNHDGIDKTFIVPLPASLQQGVYRLFFIDKYRFYKQNFLVQ